jgi:predicted aldo/keto reductase-like oxidoreductase
MIYRRFGKTGLEISALSAGFMRSMHSWQSVSNAIIPLENQKNLEDVVRTALELGINHFETANAYGTSEQQLGVALRDVPRGNFMLQTKVQPTEDPKKFIDDFYVSLNRLQMDRVDLLAIHGINDYRSLWRVCRENGCFAAARKLQKKGKVGAIGFSGHAPIDVLIEAICFDGDGGFDYVNLHWYYIYQINSRALEEAAKRDMGVFIISPTDKGGMLQDPPKRFCQLCSPLQPMVFNDVYCLTRPEVHTISIGAASSSDFAAHVEALNHLDGGDVIAKIDEQCCLAMVEATGFSRPEALWGKLPSWEKTPGLMNIPFVLWLYNLARGWGLLSYSRGRYKKLGQEVKWVPGNNGAGASCYDLKSIAAGVGLRNDELVSLLEEAHLMLGEQ